MVRKLQGHTRYPENTVTKENAIPKDKKKNSTYPVAVPPLTMNVHGNKLNCSRKNGRFCPENISFCC